MVLVWQTIAQVTLSPLAMLVLGHASNVTAGIIGYSILTGALASVHQILLTKGLARERVGPASAMQSTMVLASFGLQAALTPDDVLEPLAVVGALAIAASVAVILTARGTAAPAHRDTRTAGGEEAGRTELTRSNGALSRAEADADASAIDDGQELNDAARAAIAQRSANTSTSDCSSYSSTSGADGAQLR